MPASWTVFVDDNFHYMDESERYRHGVFDSYAAAVQACQAIVDTCLRATEAKTAEELYEIYVTYGDDPWIEGPPPEPDVSLFSAWDYARHRCKELAP